MGRCRIVPELGGYVQSSLVLLHSAFLPCATSFVNGTTVCGDLPSKMTRPTFLSVDAVNPLCYIYYVSAKLYVHSMLLVSVFSEGSLWIVYFLFLANLTLP